eukprot:CAMPEP_0185173112 /NCGR_PEP_ID=MMETSP1139-20130426/22817_1 /TAXON_ID=298111 /ORGANISM="Pavlova sp., Strain CCMP459" /LENGTH=36 /DNA_ID= /DNA_START= /DNA_END= /DNA_ORIENTATION=
MAATLCAETRGVLGLVTSCSPPPSEALDEDGRFNGS